MERLHYLNDAQVWISNADCISNEVREVGTAVVHSNRKHFAVAIARDKRAETYK